jgi:hypothetical protein
MEMTEEGGLAAIALRTLLVAHEVSQQRVPEG